MVWFGSHLQVDSTSINAQSFVQYLENLRKRWEDNASVELLMRQAVFLIWRIWKARNDKVFKGQRWEPNEVFLKAASDEREFSQVWSQTESVIEEYEMDHQEGRSLQRWKPPTGMLYKLNIDGAWTKTTGVGGMGIVIRDAKGMFIAGMAKKISFMRSAQMVEATALREGLQFALDMGIRGLMVESDAKGIIECLNRRRVMMEEIGILCDDIWLLGQAAQVTDYSYTPRIGNRVADAIAKFALRVDDFDVWLEHHPSWLSPLIEEDLPLNL